jgi:hypothetical protein
MEILAVQTIEPRMKAHCTRAVYRIVIVEPAQLSELPHRVSALLGEAECWVAREKPTHRRVDIRPFIVNLRLEDSSLIMEFHVTPSGSARPDEVLHLLGLGDLLAAGAVLERTELEIEDESCPSAPISASPAACIAEEIVETSLLMAEG